MAGSLTCTSGLPRGSRCVLQSPGLPAQRRKQQTNNAFVGPHLHLRVDQEVQVPLAVPRLLVFEPKVRARRHMQAGRQHLWQDGGGAAVGQVTAGW